MYFLCLLGSTILISSFALHKTCFFSVRPPRVETWGGTGERSPKIWSANFFSRPPKLRAKSPSIKASHTWSAPEWLSTRSAVQILEYNTMIWYSYTKLILSRDLKVFQRTLCMVRQATPIGGSSNRETDTTSENFGTCSRFSNQGRSQQLFQKSEK